MNDDYSHLAKADIFSLGVTLHEAGSGLAMPKNGRIWREFRRDMAPPLEQASPMFNEILLVSMLVYIVFET